MAMRRVNPAAVKMHRSYTAGELADRLGVHKNTIRHWQAAGLPPIDRTRPFLFQGGVVRAFLQRRNASRKCPCPPGTIYCLRCRAARAPALGMVDYVETKPGTGNLKALCEACSATMHRRVRRAVLAAVMPGIDIHMAQAPQRLSGPPAPSLNCDIGSQGSKR
jgi:hypothetical protein